MWIFLALPAIVAGISLLLDILFILPWPRFVLKFTAYLATPFKPFVTDVDLLDQSAIIKLEPVLWKHRLISGLSSANATLWLCTAAFELGSQTRDYWSLSFGLAYVGPDLM